jgi:TP901 family phage tail tape measure protein
MTTTVATLQALFTANTSDFEAGAGRVESTMQNMGQRIGSSLTNVGNSMKDMGMSFAPMAAALSAVGYAGIGAASNFDSSMAEISARTGIVGTQLQQISDFALQMGADTSFSAQQAADGFLQLLSSGQSAEQAMSTLPTVLDMAAASGEDLGRTADVLTDIMASFQLPIESVSPEIASLAAQLGITGTTWKEWGDNIIQTTPSLEMLGEITGHTTAELYEMFTATDNATMVATALAQAAGASSADIASLGQGFANVGGVANAFGLSVTDTAATLAIFAENGIKGAEAGTQLKSMLLNMSRDTDEVIGIWEDLGFSMYDAMGNARPLNDVIGDLNTAMAGMTTEEQNTLISNLAGSYGQLGLRALLAAGGTEDMTTAMAGQATAAQVAAARMNTFKGRMDALKGSVETLLIKAFTPFMNNALKPLMEYLTIGVNKLTEFTEEHPRLTMAVIAAGAAFVVLTTALITIGTILASIGAVVGAVSAGWAAVAVVLPLAGSAFGALGAVLVPFLGTALLLAAVVGGLYLAFNSDFGGFRTAIQETSAAIKQDDLPGALEGIGKTLMAIPMGIATWIGAQAGINVPEGLSAWGGTMDLIGIALGAIPGYITDWVTTATTITVPEALNTWSGILDLIGTALTALPGYILSFMQTAAAIFVPQAFKMFETVSSTISGLIENLPGKITGFIGAAAGIITPIGLTLMNTTFNSVQSLLGSIPGAIDGLIGAVSRITVPDGLASLASTIGGIAGNAASAVGSLLELAGLGGGGGSAVSGLLDAIPGNAAGTSWTGSMGTSQVAGLVHGREAVIPAGGMSVNLTPSPNGLIATGSGGGSSQPQVIQIMLDRQVLYEAMVAEGNSRP